MLPESSECVLCADEISIKSNLFYNISKDEIIGFNETNNRKTYDPPKFVLVLMIQDRNDNWKQPIAFFFCIKQLYRFSFAGNNFNQ